MQESNEPFQHFPQSVQNRFWAKVDIMPGLGPHGDCWQWTGAIDQNGYGAFKLNGKKRNTHRVAFELLHGKITGNYDVMHICDNRLCCRDSHLKLGTRSENVADASEKQRLAIGERNPNSQLTVPLVRAIKLLKEMTEMSPKQISKALELPERNVYHILSGKTWKHIQ